jgi:hypothetical protein
VCEPRHVCTAASLLRILQIGDVEDAHAAEALVADRRHDALQAAVDAAARLLDRMNSRLPQIDTSPCPPGQTTDATQLRLVGTLDVVGVKP